MRIDVFGKRLLSINEGPTEDVKSVAKARDWRIAGQGSMYIPDLTQDPTRSFKKMRDLRHIYLQGAYISEAVDLYPLYTIGAGYTLEIAEDAGESGEAAKADTEDFLNGINVYDITWQMMVDAITVRDGLAEIVMGRGSMAEKPVNVIPRPAECFEFDTEKSGAILRYIQRNANNGDSLGAPVPLEKKQVLHYQFMSRPDSPYGISLIERVIHDIKRDTRVIEATANGICLHGTPKWQIALNKNRPDAAKASDADWEEFKKQFDEINAKDNFPTEGDIEMIMHDTAGVPNVQQYSDVSLARVVSGMGIPGELLGLRQGTTDATAVTRVGAFFKKIKSCQRDVEQMWNIVIDMRTGVPGLVKMVLNDTDPQDFAKMATAISQLRTGTDPDAVCPADWCREQLGIPNDERSDEEKPKRQENPFQEPQNPFLERLDRDYPTTPLERQKLASEKEMAAAAHELAEAVRKG
jgi:hypothetical protein